MKKTKQDQFLSVVDRDEAERRFHAVLRLEPLGCEKVDLDTALGRVLADHVVAQYDVPLFDRSNYDGYAVLASDTYGATEQRPQRLRMVGPPLLTGVTPTRPVNAGMAMPITTGAMLPRGADAVVMVEDTDEEGDGLVVRRGVNAGFGVSFAGTDIACGETVLWRGQQLTSRETGVLAAIGSQQVSVYRRPRVGILSTGDEIVRPGSPIRPGQVFDSNARILADAVRELGGKPELLGIAGDDLDHLIGRLQHALETCDVVLLSGGTSKGAGDVSYTAVDRFTDPGIVAHGVALKPGKPICLAAHHGKPVVVLPGFPTSAIFTFHEFLTPVIRRLAGVQQQHNLPQVEARMAVPVRSQIGRTEYYLVGLVNAQATGASAAPPWAYPMGKGSGSVTSFSRADGFVTIPRHDEMVASGQSVTVQLLAPRVPIADLVVIGSHCVGLDYLLGALQQQGYQTKFMAVGSLGGLEATRRAQCDVAGIHLYDPATQTYNRPFITDDLALLHGYRRMQGILYRPDDKRFKGKSAEDAIRNLVADPECIMINRNQGSGTRQLIDRLLQGAEPPGYAIQPRNHNAVAAAIAQHRADWGVAVQHVAGQSGLGFLPLTAEQYDFVMPRSRADNPAIAALRQLLNDPSVQTALSKLGCEVTPGNPQS